MRTSRNKTVVRSLLADLVGRGLKFDDGLLVACWRVTRAGRGFPKPPSNVMRWIANSAFSLVATG